MVFYGRQPKGIAVSVSFFIASVDNAFDASVDASQELLACDAAEVLALGSEA
jgi:hypothetical protein